MDSEQPSFLLRLGDALRPLADPEEILIQAARLLGEYLQASRVGYAEDGGDGETITVMRHYTDRVPGIEGTYRYDDYGPRLLEAFRAGRTVIRPDIARDPTLTDAEKQAHALLQLGATVNVPLVKAGKLVAVLFLHFQNPHPFSAHEVTLLEEVAERTWAAVERARAEAALRESEARLRLALDAAAMGTFVWHVQEDRGEPDARMRALFGQTDDRPLTQEAALEEIVHPDDRERYAAAVVRACDPAGDGALREEVRVVLPDGAVRWLAITARVFFDDEPRRARRMVGTAVDVTERKRTEEELERRVVERTAELARVSALRHELLRRLVTVQEAERGRIARDLHDDTGQQIAALLLGLASLRPNADPAARALLTQLESLAQDVAQKSHRLSFTLRPTALDDLGLVEALRNYTEEWSAWSGLPVEMETVGMGEQRLPAEIETTVYRVAQEALTNILKHAAVGEQKARRVSVALQRSERDLLLVVEDDGPGFELEEIQALPPGRRRLGVFGMLERARLVQGSLDIESGPGQGTAVFLRIPLL